MEAHIIASAVQAFLLLLTSGDRDREPTEAEPPAIARPSDGCHAVPADCEFFANEDPWPQLPRGNNK